MAERPHPFDESSFRDLSTDADSADENTYDSQQHIGPLTPLRTATALKGKPHAQGNRRRLLPFLMGAISAVVILSCLSAGAIITVNLLSFQNSLNGPQTTLNDFYSALHSNDYQSAYDQLSSRYQHALSYNAFQAKYAALDVLNGSIESHQITAIQSQSDNATASIELVRQMQSGNSIHEHQTVQLIVEESNWKIDQISPAQIVSG